MRTQKLLSTLLSAVILAGCGNIKDVAITSCELDSLTPRGFRSVDAVLLVGVHNPAMQMTVEDIGGMLYMDDAPLASFEGDSLVISRHSDDTYKVSGSATLDGAVTVMDFLGAAVQFDIERFSADIRAKVRLRSGVSKEVEMKKVPLSKLFPSSEGKDKI